MLLKGYPERNYLLTKDPTTLMPFGLKTIIFNGSSYIVQTEMPENADENGGFRKRFWKWSVLKTHRLKKFHFLVWKGENGCFKNTKVWPEAELPWKPSLVWVQLKLHFSKHNRSSSTARATSDLLNLTIRQTQEKNVILHGHTTDPWQPLRASYKYLKDNRFTVLPWQKAVHHLPFPRMHHYSRHSTRFLLTLIYHD